MRAGSIFALLILLSVSSATILESGDNGVQFAKRTALEKCGDDAVDAVYVCMGNVVKAVSGDESTFYKPEGKTVHCPNVSASQMGAECVQMLMPNYCTAEFQCPVPAEPPHGTGTSNGSIVEDKKNATEPAVPVDTVPADEAGGSQPLKNGNPGNVLGVRLPGYNGESESLLGYLAMVVFGLGVAAVSILFVLFRKAIADDET